MKKYLFIILLVGVCFGQKNPNDTLWCSYCKTELENYNIAKEISNLQTTQGRKLDNETEAIFLFQANNGNFGKGSFIFLSEYFHSLGEKALDVHACFVYYEIIRSCGGSNEFTNEHLRLKINSLKVYLDITRRAIKEQSNSLKNEYSVSKLANDYLRYIDMLQGIIDS